MRNRLFTALCSALVCVCIIFCSVVSIAALDDKYTIDELGLSIKIPKEYTVVTRTLERDDEAFKELGLDYDETMTAFFAANIYLQAVSDDGVLKITLTKTSDPNSEAVYNYSQLSSPERNQILQSFMSSGIYTSGVEIKHNGIIYFDLALTQQTQTGEIYAYQCHTVVNGMNFNLTVQKNNEDLTADEIKVVTNIANTISFDKIKRTSGPSFEWWRVLLWILILVAIAYLAKYFYGQYNKSKRDKLKSRKERIRERVDISDDDMMHGDYEYTSEPESTHSLLSDLGFEHQVYDDGDDEISFDELLGYDTIDYHERANTDMDAFDINVRGRDRSHGVSYFEDSGRSLEDDKDKDYFEDFFTEKTPKKSKTDTAMQSVVTKLRKALVRLGYFADNVYKMIFGNKKKRRRK